MPCIGNRLDVNTNCNPNFAITWCGESKIRRGVIDFDLSGLGTGLASTSANNTFTGNNTYSGTGTFSGNNTYAGTNTYSGATTFNGAVALNGNTTIGNATTDLLGFYGATAIARPTALTQTYAVADDTLGGLTSYLLTDNTTGTPSTAVEDVTAAFSQTILNNNFADLTEAHNKLKADHDDLAQFVNSLTDKLQSLGLLA